MLVLPHISFLWRAPEVLHAPLRHDLKPCFEGRHELKVRVLAFRFRFGKADFLDPLNTPPLRSFPPPLSLDRQFLTYPLLRFVTSPSPFLPPFLSPSSRRLSFFRIPDNPQYRQHESVVRYHNTIARAICACSPIERHPFNPIIPRIQSSSSRQTDNRHAKSHLAVAVCPLGCSGVSAFTHPKPARPATPATFWFSRIPPHLSRLVRSRPVPAQTATGSFLYFSFKPPRWPVFSKPA